MKTIQKIEFQMGSKEERLPDYTSDFPYIMSYAELDKYIIPWHWHKAIELFYIESGSLEYYTPKGKTIFPSGSGGFINSNILHMTKTVSNIEKNIQLLHIFDASLISGNHGSRIEKKYVIPLITSPNIEILGFYPDNPAHSAILKLIKDAFSFSDNELGFEIKIREIISKIWLMIYADFYSQCDGITNYDKNDERLKMMLIYIHEHFADKIAISELASAIYLSERECFRLFHSYLHTTPTEYIRSYRLQESCRKLVSGQDSITDIGRTCGLGNSSYFGKIFKEYIGCTPVEYRNKWRNNDI